MSSPHQNSLRATRNLLARVFDLGVARVSLIAARALLFVFLGLALEPSVYGAIAVMLVMSNLFSVLIDMGIPMV